MAQSQIRRYQDSDEETVKEIFTLGMSELIPSTFTHVLKQSLTQMLLIGTFCALITSSGSLLLTVLALTLLLAGIRHFVGYSFNRYIQSSLGSDLKNIGHTYLQQQDSAFWVAELDGRVVATVGCGPKPDAPGCLELRRLSVLRAHRGRGVAKALCGKVVELARSRGYTAVILSTSVIQTDAHRLYEALGFKKIREFLPTAFGAKLMNMSALVFRLDLQRESGN